MVALAKLARDYGKGPVQIREISEKENPKTLGKSKEIAREGGKTARVAKDRIEKRLGEKVVTPKNAEEIHFNKRIEKHQ